jgi:hypothetical protein
LPERIGNQTNIREISNHTAVCCCDTCALLPTVLQSVQAVERYLCSVTVLERWKVDPNDPALIVRGVGVNRSEAWKVFQGLSPCASPVWTWLLVIAAEP